MCLFHISKSTCFVCVPAFKRDGFSINVELRLYESFSSGRKVAGTVTLGRGLCKSLAEGL